MRLKRTLATLLLACIPLSCTVNQYFHNKKVYQEKLQHLATLNKEVDELEAKLEELKKQDVKYSITIRLDDLTPEEKIEQYLKIIESYDFNKKWH